MPFPVINTVSRQKFNKDREPVSTINRHMWNTYSTAEHAFTSSAHGTL